MGCRLLVSHFDLTYLDSFHFHNLFFTSLPVKFSISVSNDVNVQIETRDW